jgi:hypothetical protein
MSIKDTQRLDKTTEQISDKSVGSAAALSGDIWASMRENPGFNHFQKSGKVDLHEMTIDFKPPAASDRDSLKTRLLDSSLEPQQRLQIVRDLVKDGVTSIKGVDESGKETNLRLDVSKTGNRELVHLWIDQDGRERVALRGLANGDKIEQQRGKNGQLADFEGKGAEVLAKLKGNPKDPDKISESMPKPAFEKHEARLGERDSKASSFKLEKVTDPTILKQVPSATYIGIEGNIRAMDGKTPIIKTDQRLWLSEKAATGLIKAQAILDAEGKGKRIDLRPLNSAGRLHDAQEAIAKANPHQVHAKKGHSNHEHGNSIDINNYGDKDVVRALRAAGFVFGDRGKQIKNDPVHFTYRGLDDRAPAHRHHRKGKI